MGRLFTCNSYILSIFQNILLIMVVLQTLRHWRRFEYQNHDMTQNSVQKKSIQHYHPQPAVLKFGCTSKTPEKHLK